MLSQWRSPLSHTRPSQRQAPRSLRPARTGDLRPARTGDARPRRGEPPPPASTAASKSMKRPRSAPSRSAADQGSAAQKTRNKKYVARSTPWLRRRPRERCMYLAGLVSLGLREIAVITLVEGCVCCAYIGRLLPSEPRPYRLTGKHRHKHAQDGSPDTLPYPPSSNPDRPTPCPRTAARRRIVGDGKGTRTEDGRRPQPRSRPSCHPRQCLEMRFLAYRHRHAARAEMEPSK